MPPLAAVVLGFGLGSGFSVHAADSQNSTKSALLDTAGFAATKMSIFIDKFLMFRKTGSGNKPTA